MASSRNCSQKSRPGCELQLTFLIATVPLVVSVFHAATCYLYLCTLSSRSVFTSGISPARWWSFSEIFEKTAEAPLVLRSIKYGERTTGESCRQTIGEETYLQQLLLGGIRSVGLIAPAGNFSKWVLALEVPDRFLLCCFLYHLPNIVVLQHCIISNVCCNTLPLKSRI